MQYCKVLNQIKSNQINPQQTCKGVRKLKTNRQSNSSLLCYSLSKHILRAKLPHTSVLLGIINQPAANPPHTIVLRRDTIIQPTASPPKARALRDIMMQSTASPPQASVSRDSTIH